MDANDRLKDKLARGLSVTVEHLITSVKRSRLNSGYELANPLSELPDPPTPVLCPSPSLFPLSTPVQCALFLLVVVHLVSPFAKPTGTHLPPARASVVVCHHIVSLSLSFSFSRLLHSVCLSVFSTLCSLQHSVATSVQRYGYRETRIRDAMGLFWADWMKQRYW